MTLRILEGSTFCICDDLGDFVEQTHGFFAEDTRVLSRLNLTLNGKRPLLLTSNNVDYFSAAFYMRNPLAGGLAQDVVSIERRRFVGEGIQDFVVLQNQGMEPLELTLELEVGCDFADILSVKAYDFALGDPLGAPPLPGLVSARYERDHKQFVLVDGEDAALARNLKEPALHALAWIDRYGDRDGDGFVEYERRSDHGILNQSWKDSNDSIRFADGTIARAPIAACEVQGYVYDAKVRLAEIAREVWRDRELGARLEREAEELRRRFDEAFWIEERGGYYALALDAEKRQGGALCSNIR